MEQRVKLIKSYNDNSNNISSIVSQMIQTRGKLERDLKKYIEFNSEFDNECPLCGDSKESIEVLINQINEKAASLRASLDVNAKAFDNELEDFYSNYIEVIIGNIEEWLEKNTLEKDFITQLVEYRDSIPDMEKAKDWFREQNISIDPYINSEMKFVEDIEKIFQALQKEIKRKN